MCQNEKWSLKEQTKLKQRYQAGIGNSVFRTLAKQNSLAEISSFRLAALQFIELQLSSHRST